MTADTAAPALVATARKAMDRIRCMVLGTIDEEGCTRTSGVLRPTVPPGADQQAVYVAGTAREVQPAARAKHRPRAFRPERGARACTPAELTGEADLRLWVLRVDRWEVHISGAHPTLGSRNRPAYPGRPD
jgi:hypothetical protein